MTLGEQKVTVLTATSLAEEAADSLAYVDDAVYAARLRAKLTLQLDALAIIGRTDLGDVEVRRKVQKRLGNRYVVFAICGRGAGELDTDQMFSVVTGRTKDDAAWSVRWGGSYGADAVSAQAQAGLLLLAAAEVDARNTALEQVA